MGTHKLRLQGRPALGLVVFFGHGVVVAIPHRAACRLFAPLVSGVLCNREQLQGQIQH
jgi:hypothetical protein